LQHTRTGGAGRARLRSPAPARAPGRRPRARPQHPRGAHGLPRFSRHRHRPDTQSYPRPVLPSHPRPERAVHTVVSRKGPMSTYGIDLGTTYSCVASVDDTGRATITKNIMGHDTTPSVVYLESPTNVV